MRVLKICLARPLLESQKKFSRRQIKNLFLTKVAQCSGDEKRYIQHDHMTNIGLWNHKQLKKTKAKSSVECPFEIIGFKC